ncbi:TPA: hypothetical protein L4R01_003746 [Pseudomonas aeruginosa]|uniref:hypothetical protein n=1 Tax=Pseudomonas aeruginosa TaxID=287 RepID=UPI00057A9093|nr:hypothetical protein [Pseudomonas aeruginosa]EKV3157273.1 hypothetical protein [Pseudomonas aeruginosa]MBG6369723.1 hypothetical protein [Pseudomonas aeruginosa]MCO1666864.1 hypothetical protein [Pseudomonas aeruginosa]MCO1722168.1 hypothetical protein [Pseudomonas aeruginosa]MCT5447565.1 hypothetical protein [Pseudomonas aeruginosa]
MSFEYNRYDLVQKIGQALSEFFFDGVGEATKADELRARAEAMGAMLGRIQAVVAEEGSVGADTLLEIRRLELAHSKSLAADCSSAIRPGGDVWRAIQRE